MTRILMVLENMIGLNQTRIVHHLINQESASLTLARDWIGSLHSNTSGKIQDYKVVQTDYRNIVFFTTLALSALGHTILDAAYIFGHRNKANSEGKTNPKLQEISREAYAFISGTGLDLMIEYYQLDYDAEEIRFQFYQRFKPT